MVKYAIGMGGVLTALAVRNWLRQRRRQPIVRKPKTNDPLDQALFHWSDSDPFTVRDLLNGGVAITGRVGSGKTSSSGKLIGESIVRQPGSGGLILAAKPEDLAMWQAIFAAAGRANDLLVFSPDSPLRCNFLGYVLGMGGHTRDVTRFITTVGETLRSASGRGENAEFWEQEQNRMIHNTVEVVKLATGTVTAPDIQKFIGTAAMSPAQLETPAWWKTFHSRMQQAASDRPKTAIQDHDYNLAADYWLEEFPSMSDKMRSAILTGVMGILHVFNTGVVRELVSTTTNVSPDDILAGKWVIVDMSPAEWGDMGLIVASSWKFLAEKAVLRRKADANSSIVTVWCDEAAQFVNSFDSHYITQCRSHMGCLVFLTQSLHSYYGAMPGQTGKHQADALLTNFGHKVLHALGDEDTAKWAQGLIGRHMETFIGTSMAPNNSMDDEINGRSNVTTSMSEKYEAVLQTNAFMHGLRCGGAANNFLCDGIVIRSGEPFANGGNWLQVAFSQK